MTPKRRETGHGTLRGVFKWSSLCGARPAVMGVVNVTPDSFSDGGEFLDPDRAVAHGLALVAEGADVLDVGGESTRPGAQAVSEDEERARVLDVVRALAASAAVPISVDTTKASVAADALDAGASVVNDVSAGRGDPAMLATVADAGAGFVVMHMHGEPRTMQRDPRYDDVVNDVADFLVSRLDAARVAGIHHESLCADPGIGFGKTVHHNLELVARLRELADRVDVPVLVGTSRKTFIGWVTDVSQPSARDDGTLATTVWAIEHGASVVRVHAVRQAVEAVRLLTTMQQLDVKAVA